jgi:DsbC/DsbD-like thiol-disulfide interchange protein
MEPVTPLMPIRELAGIKTLRMIAMFVTAIWLMAFTPAQAAPNHMRASLIAEGPAQPGGTVTLALLMQPEPGWHGYWSNPGDAGYGLTLDWSLAKGASTGAMQFPVPQTLVIQGLMNHVYEHDYAVLVPLKLPADATPGTLLPISVKAQWLVCTNEICVPERAELQGTVTVGSGPGDKRFEAWRAALPAPLDRTGTFAVAGKALRLALPFPASAALDSPHLFLSTEGLIDYGARQRFFRDGDRLVVEVPLAKSPATVGKVEGVLAMGKDAGGIAFAANPGTVPTGGNEVGGEGEFSAATLGFALLGAFLGGVILNVMPCVFPILSLKALALARGNSHNARSEGLAYTAGVVLACLMLGGVMLALRAGGEQVGWAFQLQEPGVVAVLILLAIAITANFAGLYELPGLSVERGAGNSGAFGTGLLAAFVATPCTGLALPFLLIGFVPALRRLLPKPGKWMERFRRVMAIPMGLTAAGLLWLASRLGGQAFAGVLLLLAAVLVVALWFVGREQRSGRSTLRWMAPTAAVMIAVAATGAPRLASTSVVAEEDLLGSVPFDEAKLAEARVNKLPVFLYFTADWCLSCKVNEKVAIETSTVDAAFRIRKVIVMKGDWTRRDPKITRFLASHGAAGVPLYLWYPNGGGEPRQLPQVLTKDMLVDLVGE